VVAGLALIVALALAATVVVAFFTLPDQVAAAEREVSLPDADVFGTTISGWYLAAVLSAILSVVTAALAVRWVGHWPEMGSRYDAPRGAGASGGTEAPPEDASSLDLWKSIDEGRDPTV